jgi:hypothetical protein
MNIAHRILLAAALLAAGTLGVVAASAQDKAQDKSPDYGALVKSLGDDQFQVRTKAYEDLEKAGAEARKALEEGAKSTDAQVKWSAERLLRRLDEGAAPRGVLRFGEETGRLPEIQDIEQQFREMERRFEDLRGNLRLELLPGNAGGVRVERRAIVEKDGERIDATVGADGKVTVRVGDKTFEAKDMATLGKEHPEIAAKVKGLLGEQDEIRGWGWPTWSEQGNELLDRLNRASRTKPVLGVTLSAVPPVLRTQLSMKEGEGVVVEEVLPDTPAQKMGLQRHDVILSVNGAPVSAAPAVRAAVEAVKEGGELKLRILRGGKAEEIAGVR